MINKSLLVAISLFATFGLAVLFIFQKFLHLSIGHTVYYCQNIIKSLSFQLPQTMGIALISLLLLTITVPIFRLLLNFYAISGHKKNLIPSLKSNLKLLRLIRKLKLGERIVQIESAKLFAYCVGIKKPQIYISSGLVTQVNVKELEAILLHEKSHLDNHDPLVLTLLSLTQNIFPYFPILSDLIRNFRIEREIRADKFAVSQQGDMQPLLSAMKKLLLVPDSDKFAFSVGVGELDTLEVRIHMLLEKKLVYKKFHLLNLLVTTLTILVVGFAALTPVHAIENHDDGRDVMMICPNNDSCVSWCQRNQSITPNQPMENSSHPYSTK